MTLAAKKPCAYPCCPALVQSGMCSKHAEKAKQRQYDQRNADPVRRLYHTRRWEHFTDYMLTRNVLCQRLVDGKQCEQFSTICHHIVSPRVELHRMFDAENILCVCVAHHPNTEGEHDVSRYVPTVT